MKESKEIILQISNYVWESADRLRGSYVHNESYYLLFLLSGFKDGLFEDVDDALEVDLKIIWAAQNHSFYKNIFAPFKGVISNMGKQYLYSLLNAFKDINRSQLEENFQGIFEQLLKKVAVSQGKKSGESFQPYEVTKLAVSLADLPEDASIYNPFAGYASYGIELKRSKNYVAQEINDMTWAIGQLRLKAHQLDDVYNYTNDDSIANWDSSIKYDLVVATPPFRSRIPKDYYSFLTGDRINNIENYFIDRSLNSIKPKGKVIAVLPRSFLFTRGGRYYQFKKHLVENNLIDTVISLPSGLFYNTVIPVCIVVFSPIQHRKGYIRLVDVSELYHPKERGFKTLDIEKIENLLQENTESNLLRYADLNQIAKNEFNLSVDRYFLKEINGVKLSDLASIISGTVAPIGSKMHQIQIKELKDDILDCELKLEELKARRVERGTFKIIEESCILIAVIGNAIKPTYFEYKGQPICISRAVLALSVKTSIVDPIFLINEFHSDYVKDQSNAYRVGDFQITLSRRDLMSIEFKIPPLNEQLATVSAVKDLSSKFQQIEVEKENLLTGIKKEEVESSTSLSHVLGKPLLSIGSSIEIIQNALSNLNPEWKNHLIIQSREYTLKDAFDSISSNIKYIQELADRNTSLVNVSKFELNSLELIKLFKEFVKLQKQSLPPNIKIELDVHEDIRDHYKNKVFIKGNSQKLKIVLYNLLDNAKNHAFTDKKQNHTIKIEVFPFVGGKEEAAFYNYKIDENKSYIRIRFLNSGLPFPKDMTLDDYKRKHFVSGKSGNKGLGGYEINEILKVHNEGKDALDIITNYKGGVNYTSEVSFIIPIIENYE